MNRPRARPAAFVFVQRGCPACHDYMPKFQRVSRGFPHPIGIYDVAQGGHPTEFGNHLGIRATPTTIVMDSAGRMHRRAGALAEAEIRELLGRAR